MIESKEVLTKRVKQLLEVEKELSIYSIAKKLNKNYGSIIRVIDMMEVGKEITSTKILKGKRTLRIVKIA